MAHSPFSPVTAARIALKRRNPAWSRRTMTMERGWRESVDDLFLQPAAAIAVVTS
jgi:hypothetical protein